MRHFYIFQVGLVHEAIAARGGIVPCEVPVAWMVGTGGMQALYGLEYKYLTLHVIGKLSYEEMFRQLEIAIHQFAKRQMTYFRGMEERRGVKIHWIDATLPMDEKIEKCIGLLSLETV